MWVNLEACDIDAIVAKFGDGPIVDKSLARPDRETGSFLLAAEAKFSNNRNFLIDDDAIVTRARHGAWVMTWAWIDETTADVPPALDFYLLDEGTERDVRALQGFRVGKVHDADDGMLQLRGRHDGWEWCFEVLSTFWSFDIFLGLARIWSHSERWGHDGAAYEMQQDQIFKCLLKAIGLWQNRPAGVTFERPHIKESKFLRLLVLGEIGPDLAARITGLGGDVIDDWVGRLITEKTKVAVSQGSSGVLSLTGGEIEGLDTGMDLSVHDDEDTHDEDDGDDCVG